MNIFQVIAILSSLIVILSYNGGSGARNPVLHYLMSKARVLKKDNEQTFLKLQYGQANAEYHEKRYGHKIRILDGKKWSDTARHIDRTL